MDEEGEAPVRRCAAVFQHGELAGHLKEAERGRWTFCYIDSYAGAAVSLTLPVRAAPYGFDSFPAVFEGLLPEGPQLEALLRKHKIDRGDAYRQLVTVGADLVGSLTVHETTNAEE